MRRPPDEWSPRESASPRRRPESRHRTTGSAREERLVEAFKTLATGLAAECDPLGLLQTLVESCTALFDVIAAGVLLVDVQGELEVVASSGEANRIVGVLQLAARAGPCIECVESGRVVAQSDISQSPARWNTFARAALAQGFPSICAIPMGAEDTTIGTLALLGSAVGEPDRSDLRAAQALAAVAAAGIRHDRAARAADAARTHLTLALESRVIIEQAKGVLASAHDVTMDAAFSILRGYARDHGTKLSAVAEAVVARRLRI